MGMGSFNRRRQYKQENAMGNAGALLGLLEAKAKQYDNVGNTVDEYGKSRVRGDVSQLMSTEEFQGNEPSRSTSTNCFKDWWT